MKGSRAVQDLVNHGGTFVSKEYSVMHREGAFGWVMAKAKVVTNSECIRDNIDKTNAGRHWMKTPDSKWMVNAVEEGINQVKEMTIMGIDNEGFATEELEARRCRG